MKHRLLLFQDTALVLKKAFHSSVGKNAGSLYVVQFANYFLPLLTVPYLVRVLEPAGYGMIAFGQSLIACFTLFVDYGFALSSTRKISVNRNDPISVSRVAFNVWAAKVLLCIAGFAVLLLLITFVQKLGEISSLLLILYGMTVGNVLFPIWLFQGMEKMVAISVINLVVRLFVVVGIFSLIRRSEDYMLYAMLMSLGSISAGVIGAGVGFHMFKLHPQFPSWRGIFDEYIEGWVLFLSQASVSLYSIGNPLVLGLLTNNTVVGYYSAAEKIVKVALGLLDPISQAAYPRFSKLASDSKSQALQWGRRMLVLMSSLGFVFFVALFVGASVMTHIVLGPGYEPSIITIRILAALPMVVGISNVLGIQLMLPFGKDKPFTFILFGGGLLNITLAFLFAPVWKESGMATAVLLSEMFVSVTMFIYLWHCKLNPLRGERPLGVLQ